MTTTTKRRARLVRVDQEIVDFMLKHERPSRPLRDFPKSIGRLRLGFHAFHASIATSMKGSEDRDADIFRQYRVKGYAEIELVAEELNDDEEGKKEESIAIAEGVAMPAMKK